VAVVGQLETRLGLAAEDPGRVADGSGGVGRALVGTAFAEVFLGELDFNQGDDAATFHILTSEDYIDLRLVTAAHAGLSQAIVGVAVLELGWCHAANVMAQQAERLRRLDAQNPSMVEPPGGQVVEDRQTLWQERRFWAGMEQAGHDPSLRSVPTRAAQRGGWTGRATSGSPVGKW
jgi:hypothetical protein